MKVGKLSKLSIENTTITSSEDSLSGFGDVNLLNEQSLELWKVQEGSVTVTLEFSSISIDAICLFNVTIENDITVKTYNSSLVETNSIILNKTDLVGIVIKNGYCELTNKSDIVKIEIITNGATSTFNTSMGYIWAGELHDFNDLEALVPTDNGADDVIITRANSTSTQQKYNSQSFKFTTNKNNLFSDLQTKIREILVNGGYSKKRPFIFKDCVYESENLILGIFDSGAFQYDLFDPDQDYAQISKGIIEVF